MSRRIITSLAAVVCAIALMGQDGCSSSEDEGRDRAKAERQREKRQEARQEARANARAKLERQLERARDQRREARQAAAAAEPAPAPEPEPEPAPEPEPEVASDCDPNYEGACLDPNSSDYDCAGGSGDGPDYTGYVQVVGSDPHGLDTDGDGDGCE